MIKRVCAISLHYCPICCYMSRSVSSLSVMYRSKYKQHNHIPHTHLTAVIFQFIAKYQYGSSALCLLAEVEAHYLCCELLSYMSELFSSAFITTSSILIVPLQQP